MVPHLYTRTFTLDDLVLAMRLMAIGHEVISAANDVPPSVIERSVELQIRLIGDDLPLDVRQQA